MDSPFNLQELRDRLRAEGVDDRAVSIDGSVRDESYCIVEEPAGWQVFYSERGRRNSLTSFLTFVEAAGHLLSVVLGDPTTRWRPRDRETDRTS